MCCFSQIVFLEKSKNDRALPNDFHMSVHCDFVYIKANAKKQKSKQGINNFVHLLIITKKKKIKK